MGLNMFFYEVHGSRIWVLQVGFVLASVGGLKVKV